MNGSQNFTGDTFFATRDGNGGTLVIETPICFLRGALIATPSGETSIKRLTVGDLILTASGAARPIVWIGRWCTSGTKLKMIPAPNPMR